MYEIAIRKRSLKPEMITGYSILLGVPFTFKAFKSLGNL